MTIPKCDLQDYLEIACLFHYRVEVQLKDGTTLKGQACDVFSKQGTETLVLKNDTQQIAVETATMVSMTVLTPGARFTQVSF